MRPPSNRVYKRGPRSAPRSSNFDIQIAPSSRGRVHFVPSSRGRIRGPPPSLERVDSVRRGRHTHRQTAIRSRTPAWVQRRLNSMTHSHLAQSSSSLSSSSLSSSTSSVAPSPLNLFDIANQPNNYNSLNNYYNPHINDEPSEYSNECRVFDPDDPETSMYFFKDHYVDFSPKRCRSFFKTYASDTDSEVIGPEGIEKLCTDLEVKPEDVAILVLSWKFKAKVMGLFTLDEWLFGMHDLECDTLAKLRAKVSYLRNCLNDSQVLKMVYRFSFDFAKDRNQRCLDIEASKQMLGLLLESRWPLLGLFVEFLGQASYRVINKDQYYNILDFSQSVDKDLINYDENSAWPVMLDEFVDWCRKYKGFQKPYQPKSGHDDSDTE